ncbi:MAG: type I-B CRISPR-associated protein Cas7/Csh2 [Promethearchaeota archaeon]
MAIKNRNEIVFIYDVRDANPNGDPDNANMPRIDEETGENEVTDVRLKRTIRDYWDAKGMPILYRAEEDEKGNRMSMDDLAKKFLEKKCNYTKKTVDATARPILAEKLPEEYIDVRSFGAAVTLKKANVSITGPVQFGLGRSLNKPKVTTRTITTTVASGEDKGQGTFGEYHVVDYSIIRFHGIVNERSAEITNFSEDDLKKLNDGLWNGTMQLNTRSKFNHMPRLLINVKSKPGYGHVGDLDICFKLATNNEPRSFSDVKLDITTFIERIKNYEENIEEISVLMDDDLTLVFRGDEVKSIEEAAKKLNLGNKIKSLELKGVWD